MTDRKLILCISGSTKKNSTNQRIAEYIQGLLQGKADIRFFDAASLPYFNPDLDSDKEIPPSVAQFREQLRNANGLLIITPEYVFSLPGVLKNALEWLVSTVLLTDKPTAFLVASASGQKAFESLDLVLTTLQAHMTDSNKLLVSGAKGKVSEDGKILDSTEQSIRAFAEAFFRIL